MRQRYTSQTFPPFHWPNLSSSGLGALSICHRPHPSYPSSFSSLILSTPLQSDSTGHAHLSSGRKIYTLVFPLCSSAHSEVKICLGLKQRGFGQGSWNGFGGKVEPLLDARDGADGLETIRNAASRELREECGMEGEGEGVVFCGIVDVSVEEGERVRIYVFWIDVERERLDGVRETQEMIPPDVLYHPEPTKGARNVKQWSVLI